MEDRAGLTQLAKIHTLLHRDVDGIKVDGGTNTSNAAQGTALHQLTTHGSYANSTGTMVVSPNPIHPSSSIGGRRGVGLPSMSGSSVSMSMSGPQRRVSVASSTLAAALRRQQQQQQIIMQQQANTNGSSGNLLHQYASNAPSSSHSSSSNTATLADSNNGNSNSAEVEDNRTPSHSSLAALNPSPASDDFPAIDTTISTSSTGVNGTSSASMADGTSGSGSGGRLRRPQIRSWKKTKETRQDALKNLDILANRYSAGASGLAAELNLGRRRVSSGSSSATPSNDVSDKEELSIETSQSSVKSPPPSASNATAPPKEKRSAFDSLEASLRKKGKEFSQFSHKFRDLVNDTLHIRSKKDKLAKSTNDDINGKQANGTRDGSKSGSRNNSGNNSLSREQALAVDAAIQSNNPNHLSLNPALSSDSVDSSATPMANLREREKQLTSQSDRDRDREGSGAKESTPWKPRNSLLLSSNLNGDASLLDYSHPDPMPSPSSAHSNKSTSDIPSTADKDGSSGFPPSLLRTFTSPTSIRPPASASNAHANNVTSGNNSSFLLPTGSSVRDRDRATTMDSDRDRLPLFLRKQSDRRIDTSDSTAGPPKLDRDRSLSNAVLPSSSGLLLSPESSKLAGGDGSWKGFNQHAVEMELQLSDLESAFTQADIGGLRSRVELLEEMNRLKKSDVEVRLQRLENELANMKQVQRSNLKTIYDALNAANLSAGSGGSGGQRKEYQGVKSTLMNWIFILLTWFGLGIATLSQPLSAMYPYLTQLACCKRIFRKAGEVASIHANGSGLEYQSSSMRSTSNSLSTDGDATYQQSHQSSSGNHANGTTSSASSQQSSFLSSSGVMQHHHTNDRDRESVKRPLKSTVSSHSNSLRLPLNAILAHRDDGSNSAASSSRGQRRHVNRDVHVPNGIPRTTTSAAAAAATAAADSFLHMDQDHDRERRSMLHDDDDDDDDDDEDADDMAVYGSAAVAAGMNSTSSGTYENGTHGSDDAGTMDSDLHHLSDTESDDTESYPYDSHSHAQLHQHSMDASDLTHDGSIQPFDSHHSSHAQSSWRGTPPPVPASSASSSSSSRRSGGRASHKSHKVQPMSMMAQLRNASNKLKASRK